MDTELDGKIAREIMGWVLDDDGYWHDGTWRVYVAAGTRADGDYDFDTWNPCENWAHFGLVLERVYGRFQSESVGPNDTLELTWWQTGDCFFRMDECYQAGPTKIGEPLQSMCEAILRAFTDD